MYIRILIFCTVCLGIQLLDEVKRIFSSTSLDDEIPNICTQAIGEALIACGGKIQLRIADQFELELIPGVSESIALEILSRREEIMSQALHLAKQEQPRALLIVKGIGVKKARKIAKYIEFF